MKKKREVQGRSKRQYESSVLGCLVSTIVLLSIIVIILLIKIIW